MSHDRHSEETGHTASEKTDPTELPSPAAIAKAPFKSEEYVLGGGLTIQTILQIDEQRTLPASLNQKDYEILGYVLSQRNLNFVHERKVSVEIGGIVKHVYNSAGEDACEHVENQLANLREVTFTIIDNKGTTTKFGFFDLVKIHKYSGCARAEITVTEPILDTYIQMQIARLYSDKIKHFQLDISVNMLFVLQKERFLRSANPQTNHEAQMYP